MAAVVMIKINEKEDADFMDVRDEAPFIVLSGVAYVGGGRQLLVMRSEAERLVVTCEQLGFKDLAVKIRDAVHAREVPSV